MFELIEKLFSISVWIDIIPFQFLHNTSQGKSWIGSQIDRLVWAYPCSYALFWIGIHFLKDLGIRALVGHWDPFNDLCCVEGISIWSDRLRKACGSNGTRESIQKRQLFSIILVLVLVLVSNPGSVSPFYHDELLAPVLHFFSVDREERGLRGKGIVTWEKQGGQPLSNIQHGFWQCSWTLMSIRMNHLFGEGKSLPDQQEDSKLQILSW